MKKKWLIAIASCALAVTVALGISACGGDEESGKSDEETAQTAVNMLNSLYLKDGKVKNYETPDDFKRLGQVNVEGTACAVVWTADVKTAGYAEYVKVGTEKDSTNQITIDVSRATVDIEYTLTASVTVNEATKTTSYDHKIPKKSSETSETASLSFETDASRVSQSTTQQVWQQNGITFTNDKGSGSNIVDSKKPVRLYKNSVVTIEFPGIIKIDFHSEKNYEASGEYKASPYRTYLKDSLTAAFPDATITEDEETNLVSLTLATPTDKVQFTCSAGQVRLYSIDVEGKSGGLTDAEKLTAAKVALKLGQTNYFMPDTVTLPAEQGGATVTWKLKEASSNVSVENGTLKVTSLPTAATEVILKATLTLNKETADKEITIKLLPAPTLTNEGTEAKPYTAAEAKTITNLVDENGYFSLAGEAKAVYVHGYVIATGEWNGDFSNWTNVYIADTKTAETTDVNSIMVYRLVADGTLLAAQEGALKKGAEITVLGYLQNYKGRDGLTPEITSHGDNVVNATSYTYVDNRTPAEKVQDALDLVPSTLTVSKTGDTTLPVSSEPDVTFAWAVKGNASLPQGVTLASGKLSVSELPAEETTVTLVVTASISGGTSETKDVTVTIKPQGSEPVEGDLVLTTETLFAGIEKQNSYAVFDGAHTVGSASITTSKVMISTSDDYPDTLQFQKSNGTITLSGTFTKIVIVVDTSYDLVNPTVTVGTTSITGTADTGVDHGTTGTNFPIKRYTIEYNINVAGVQTVTIKTANSSGAMYVPSITLTGTPEGGSVTPGPGGDEPSTPTGTFTAIEAPVAGTEYYMAMTKTDGTVCYFNGSKTSNGYYLATSTNVSDAVKVSLEADGSNWVIKVGSQYIEMVSSTDDSGGTHVNATLSSSKNGTWTWNTTYKFFTWEINSDTYALGAYGTSANIGTSASKYFTSETNYFAKLGTLGEGGGTEPEPETDKDKVEAAEKALTLSKTTLTTVGESIDLPDLQGEANISWKMEPSTSDYVTLANGKLTVDNLPTDQSVTVKLIATLSVNNETTTKEFTITINKEITIPQPENGLVLTGESVIGPADDSTAYESGTKQIDGYDIAYTDIANNNTISVNGSFTPVGFTMLQFKKTSGKIELTGEFTKIVTVILSSHAYEANSMLAVTVGEDVLTISTHSTEEIQIGSVTHYLYTVEYVVSGSGSQKVTFSDTNNFAIYVHSITLTKADRSEPQPETAQQKVENALKEVSDEYTVTAAGDYNLPTSTVGEVTFSWAVDAEHADTYPVENGVLKVGDSLPDVETTLTLTLTANCGEDYSTTKQVTIIISAKESGPVTPSGSEVTFDLETACTATGATQLNDETAKALFDKASGNSEELFYINVASAYEGTGAGGAKPSTALLKLGASGSGGKVVLGFKKVVTSVTLKAQDFAASGTAKTISVNGEEKDLTVGSSAEITFTLTKPTTLVTISSAERAYIFSIKVTLSDDTAAAESAKIVDALTFVPETINVKDAGDYVLPTSPYTDVTFSWVSANTTYDIKEGTKLDVKELPKDAAANFNLTVTATCGSGTQQTKQVAVTVDKYVPKLTFNFESVKDGITLGSALSNDAALKDYLDDAIAGQSLTANFTDCVFDSTDKTAYTGDSNLGLYYLKLGSSSKKGNITLNFSKNVTKVVIEWRGHSGSEGTLYVNDMSKDNKSTNVVSQEWELASPSQSVTINAAKRAYIKTIIVYFEEEA